jgi:ubiquinone/menaquinone biosynthesis C-methylase UbiE
MSSNRSGPLKPNAVAYFEVVAGEYTSWYSAQTPGGHGLRARRERVFELLDRNPRGGKVLDIGCGPGILADGVLARGHEFWGLDASAEMIAQGRRRFADHSASHFELGDATRLPFPDQAFDTVICLGVIDRMAHFQSAIREMARVTKQGGAILVSFPNLLSPYAAWKRFVIYPTLARFRPIYFRLAGRPEPASPLRSFAKLHSPRGAVRLLERHGARVTDLVHYYFNVMLSPLDEIMPRAALGLARRLESLRHGPLRWLGAGFIIRAERG